METKSHQASIAVDYGEDKSTEKSAIDAQRAIICRREKHAGREAERGHREVRFDP